MASLQSSATVKMPSQMPKTRGQPRLSPATFFFARSAIISELPYDPNLYYTGSENFPLRPRVDAWLGHVQPQQGNRLSPL